MIFRAAKTPSLLLWVFLITCAPAHALCSVDVVIVKGRVDHAPSGAKVRVELVYSRDIVGESAEAAIENGSFSIPVEFLTQSHRPVVNGMFEKCNRRPKTVIVTLVEGDEGHGYDPVSLDFAKDFKIADSGTYILRSQLLLDGSR